MAINRPGRGTKTWIDAERHFPDLGLRAVWGRADLLLFLARRDIKVRYQQTFFGVLWALFQPLILVAIFWVVFGRFVKVDTGNIPYPLFGLAGLILWNLFIHSVTSAANSLHSHREMIGKIYFPRLLLPFSTVVTSVIDFLIALVLLILLISMSAPDGGIWLSPRILLAVVAILITLMAAAGLGAALAALNVMFRDLRQLVPIISQVGLLATPVAYPPLSGSEPLTLLYYLNPMAGQVTLFRAALLGTPLPSPLALGVSVGSALLMFVGGLLLFGVLERRLADIL